MGSYLLDTQLQNALRVLQNMGDTSPTNDDLIKQAYYMYNHGSNIPPGYDYVDGTLETIDYSLGDPYTYQTASGQMKTIHITQPVLDAQDNAEHVEHDYDPSDQSNSFYDQTNTIQPWLDHKLGCSGSVQ